MKKFLPYIFVILVLGSAAIWFIYKQSPGTIAKEEGDMAVKDERKIEKIVLADTDKNRVELTKQNGKWRVNGKYDAREDLIQSLMEVLTRVTSLAPAPHNAHDNIIREMMDHHVLVEVYTGGNQAEKVYFVGGPTPNSRGTYMLRQIDGTPVGRPHIMYIPGFEGYLTTRFNSEEENWRTRTIFNYQEENIKALSVEYTTAPYNSFMIDRVSSDSFIVKPTDEKYRINQTNEQKYIHQYLGFYNGVYAEAYDNTNTEKDSVSRSVPYCTISLTAMDNSINKVKIWYMPLSKRSKKQFDEKGNEMTYDIDHFYATVNNGNDFVIIQYYVFGKLLRSYRDFFFKPEFKK